MHKDSHYSKKIWMKELVGTDLLESGYSALAEYSMLNTPNVRCYAAERISQWKDVMTNSMQNSQV